MPTRLNRQNAVKKNASASLFFSFSDVFMTAVVRGRGLWITRMCGKVGFVVFAPVLIVPEVCWLAGDWLQADKLPAVPPHRLTWTHKHTQTHTFKHMIWMHSNVGESNYAGCLPVTTGRDWHPDYL